MNDDILAAIEAAKATAGERPAFLPKGIEHGTAKGYRRHKKLGERACPECTRAWAKHIRDYRRSRG